jgi:hypothetical protein
LLDDRRILIRIREAQKHVNPEHWCKSCLPFRRSFSYKLGKTPVRSGPLDFASVVLIERERVQWKLRVLYIQSDWAGSVY